MPYAIKPNLDEDEKNQQNGGGINISGGEAANFSTGIPGQESTSAKPQKSSGNYANINSYLDANRDQADQMGQKIATNVETKAQDAQSKIIGLEAKAPDVKEYDPNETYSKLGSLTDEDKNNYRNVRSTGGYTGPDSIDKVEGYNDAQKATSEASSLVKNSANEYGQQALLKDTYKRPDYSAGQNRLDQALLQGSQGSKQALEGLSQKYSDLDQLFNTASSKVGESINKAGQQAVANKNKIAQSEVDQWKNLVDPIQQRADQYNINKDILSGRIESDLSDEVLSDETLKLLGLSEGQNIYDMNLAGYLQKDLTQAGLNNVATNDERSKYQALNDLFQDQTRNQITLDGKEIKPVGFNKEQFDRDLARKVEEFNRLSQATNLSGVGYQDLISGDKGIGTSNVNLADYLARGDSAIGNSTKTDFGLNINPQQMQEAIALANADLKNQIENFLNQQKYYRKIKKG